MICEGEAVHELEEFDSSFDELVDFLHEEIEHDGSLISHQIYLQLNNGKIHENQPEEMILKVQFDGFRWDLFNMHYILNQLVVTDQIVRKTNFSKLRRIRKM